MYKVKAQFNEYNGIHPHGLRFFDGVAKTDDKEKAELYAGLGFAVSEVHERPVKVKKDSEQEKESEKAPTPNSADGSEKNKKQDDPKK